MCVLCSVLKSNLLVCIWFWVKLVLLSNAPFQGFFLGRGLSAAEMPGGEGGACGSKLKTRWLPKLV